MASILKIHNSQYILKLKSSKRQDYAAALRMGRNDLTGPFEGVITWFKLKSDDQKLGASPFKVEIIIVRFPWLHKVSLGIWAKMLTVHRIVHKAAGRKVGTYQSLCTLAPVYPGSS